MMYGSSSLPLFCLYGYLILIYYSVYASGHSAKMWTDVLVYAIGVGRFRILGGAKV